MGTWMNSCPVSAGKRASHRLGIAARHTYILHIHLTHAHARTLKHAPPPKHTHISIFPSAHPYIWLLTSRRAYQSIPSPPYVPIFLGTCLSRGLLGYSGMLRCLPPSSTTLAGGSLSAERKNNPYHPDHGISGIE